jgi:hypothetical protein
MILYVNGDSHTAAAEAVNPHGFAQDDGDLQHLGRQPHPNNLQVSWGCQLAQMLDFEFVCQAQSGGSNARILRTTRDWLAQHKDRPVFVIIQWSTWEREEWFHDGEYHQVNASGTDHIPQALQEKYKQYILGIDWNQKTNLAHDQIWQFHLELQDQGIQHVFFNGNSDFSIINQKPGQYDYRFGLPQNWGCSYIGPYDPNSTYDCIIRSAGINTVNLQSWHFGKDGHSFFARFMLQYITDNQITPRLL